MKNIPALNDPFLVSNTFKFLRSPLDFCHHLIRQDHDLISCRIGGNKVIVVLHPDCLRHILVDNSDNYTRTGAHKTIALFLGSGLLTTDGDYWKKQRKMIMPMFHSGYLQQVAKVLIREANSMQQRIRQQIARNNINLGNNINPGNNTDGSIIPVSEEFAFTTLQIVMKALLGENKDHRHEDISRSLDEIMTFFYHYTQQIVKFPMWMPFPSYQRFHQAKKNLDDWIYSIIDNRRSAANKEANLLDLLLNVRYEDTGGSMTNKQIRDEMITMSMAGHETSANALNWTMWLLSKDQQRQDTLRNEIDKVWTNDMTDPPLDAPPFLKQVINESLRLYPPAWIFGRQSIHADTINGYTVPAGSNLIISPYILHRHPAYWNNPDEYLPERFAEDATIKKNAFLPFGLGAHFCIGYRFALLEIQIIAMILLRNFKVLPPDTAVVPDPYGTLKPKNGLSLRMIPL